MERWAVICGAVRAPLEARIVVNLLIELRAQGLLDGIVLSTWRESVRDNPEFIRELSQRGIIVSETIDVKEGGNGQTYRQHRLFEQGLSICPPGSLIFKARTDKCTHRIERFIPFLERGPIPTGQDLPHFSVFNSKIVVQAQSVSMPFNYSDIAFLGLREDLLKLVHLDLYYEWVVFSGSANAEIRWFSRPFIKELPVFRQFLERINCRALSAKLVANGKSESPAVLPELVNRSLAAHLWTASQNFEIAGAPCGDKPVSFQQVFGGDTKEGFAIIPMTLTEHSVAQRGGLFEKILQDGLTDSAPAEALNDAIKALRAPELAHQLFTKEDLKGVRAFLDGDAESQDGPNSSVRTATTVKLPEGTSNDAIALLDAVGVKLPDDELDKVVAIITDGARKQALTIVYVNLADAYETGTDLPQNSEHSVFWRRLAAGEKHIGSCLKLGRHYEAQSDLKEAAHWYREAALRNNVDAQERLGELLSANPDLPEAERAREWLDRAAAVRKTEAPNTSQPKSSGLLNRGLTFLRSAVASRTPAD